VRVFWVKGDGIDWRGGKVNEWEGGGTRTSTIFLDYYIYVLFWKHLKKLAHNLYTHLQTKFLYYYTACHRRNGPNFGWVFLMLNYTDITQNTYVPN